MEAIFWPVGAVPRSSLRSWVPRPLIRLTTLSPAATSSSITRLTPE
jgi:hypothetical protein